MTTNSTITRAMTRTALAVAGLARIAPDRADRNTNSDGGETGKGGREVMEERDVIQARNGFGLNL